MTDFFSCVAPIIGKTGNRPRPARTSGHPIRSREVRTQRARRSMYHFTRDCLVCVSQLWIIIERGQFTLWHLRILAGYLISAAPEEPNPAADRRHLGAAPNTWMVGTSPVTTSQINGST